MITKNQRRIAAILVVALTAFAAGMPVSAEEPGLEAQVKTLAAEVKLLKKQLTAVRKQLAEVQKALAELNRPAAAEANADNPDGPIVVRAWSPQVFGLSVAGKSVLAKASGEPAKTLQRGQKYRLPVSLGVLLTDLVASAAPQPNRPNNDLGEIIVTPLKLSTVTVDSGEGVTGTVSLANAKEKKPTISTPFLLDLEVAEDAELGERTISVAVPLELGELAEGNPQLELSISATIE